MIRGFPTETEQEFAQAIKFLEDHKDYIYAVHRGLFSLEPESPMARRAKVWLLMAHTAGLGRRLAMAVEAVQHRHQVAGQE